MQGIREGVLAVSFFSRLFGSPTKIGGAEAVLMVRDGAKLVDVRTAAERRGNCPRRSTHMPMEKVASQCGQLGTKKPVVVVCAHGPRARMACSTMRRNGIDAYWVRGGVSAWRAAGGEMK